MLDVLSIVGTRPQLVKLQPLAKAFAASSLEHGFIDTGQHYDFELSTNLYVDLQLPEPIENLGAHHEIPSEQIAFLVSQISKSLLKIKPKLVLVYGDTNSTLAAAIACTKNRVNLAHVEAGLRSDNIAMSEEINRRVVDHMSNILFVPTQNAEKNLYNEKVLGEVIFVGDVMLDLALEFKSKNTKVLRSEKILLTLHRAENVDSETRLKSILESISNSKFEFILPIHPRLRKKIDEFAIALPKNIQLVPPLNHTETLKLISEVKAVVTDSGGIQKESLFLSTPCFTLRVETEWPETLINNSNQLIKEISDEYFLNLPSYFDHLSFGNGDAAKRIVEEVCRVI